MAYVHKHKDGWRAQVARMGVRKSAVWPTKREAMDWAAKVELEIASGSRGSFTLGEAIQKYKAEVTPKKHSARRFEDGRLDAALSYFGDVQLSEIAAPQIAQWRDERLKTVSGSTVVREANLLRNLFNIARLEWNWCDHQPFQGVKLPKENAPRHQVWTWQLIKRVLRAPRVGKTKEMQDAFHIALRTGMRLAEVLSAPENFDPARRVVTIKTKTEARAQIPIGRIAAGLLLRTPFTVGPNEGSVLFSKLCRELLIDDLTFHDARSSALTWMSRRVDVMTLARISRHRDLKILMAHYYRETPDQIAARI